MQQITIYPTTLKDYVKEGCMFFIREKSYIIKSITEKKDHLLLNLEEVNTLKDVKRNIDK